MAQAKFLEGSILKHLVVMTSTASIGLMSLFIVDLADLYFLSLLGEIELAAAVGYAGSVLFFTGSVSIGLAVAMAALVANAVGAGEDRRARRYVAHFSLFSLAVTIPVAISLWLLIPDILKLIGARGRTLELATTYLQIVLPAMPVLALAMGAGGALRAVGAARLAMLTTLGGGFTNAVLDPVLIFSFDMGIAGAAWASVASRVVVFAIGWYGVVVARKLIGRIKPAQLARDSYRIMIIAGPVVLANIATPIANAYTTAAMAEFGDDVVAGFSIIGRIIPVAFGIVFALSGAVGPVIGQNYGAGNTERIRLALKHGILLSTLVVVIASVLLMLLQETIAEVFNASPAAAEVWRFFAYFTAILFVFAGAQFVAHAAFNNLGRPLWSTVSNWARATLGTFPFVWLGADWFGPPGILAGQAAGGVIFGGGAFLVAWWLSGRSGGGGVTPNRHLMFRLPPSAHSMYRGWIGLFGRDK